MRRRDPTILFALFTAMAVHLVLLSAGVRAAHRELGWWLKTSASHPKIAPPSNLAPIPPQNPLEQLGDHDTHGSSINNAPGDEPLQSATADANQEQAALQRDPAGFGGKGSAKILEDAERGNGGAGGSGQPAKAQKSAAAIFASRESSLAQPSPKSARMPPVKANPGTPRSPLVDASAKPSDAPVAEDALSRGPGILTPPAKDTSKTGEPPQPSTGDKTNPDKPQQEQKPNPPQPTEQQQQQQQQQSPSEANAAPGKPGAPDPGGGNPIPTTDFESYPVSHIASQMVAGRIVARTGRKSRTRTLPDFDLAARADFASLPNPYVVLQLTIDENGNVISARTIHSSGSDNIDHPCEQAAVTWWFEPAKDPKTGKPHGEIMDFTIFF